MLSKARSWRIGIRNSLLDHRRHDDAPRLRHDVVSEKTCRGKTRDAWHDTARGEGAGRTARGGGSRGLCARRRPTGPAGRARGPGACPRCGGTHLVRKGHDRDGSQRWACRSCGRTLSRKTMGLLGYSKPEEDVWASYVEHACAGGTPGECARACGVCPGTSRLVRTGPSEAMGRALAPGRGQPSPARSTARAPASRRPAGGPGRRRGCPGSRSARLRAGARWKTNRV